MIYDIVCGRGLNIYKRDKFNRICLVGGVQTLASYAKASRAQKLAHIVFCQICSFIWSLLSLKTRRIGGSSCHARRLGGCERYVTRKAIVRSLGDIFCSRGDFSQNEGVFNVYGHTPIAEPDIAKFSANIDTSRVYKHELGCLCVLESERAGFYAGKYRGRQVRLLG